MPEAQDHRREPARGRLDWCCIGAQKAGTSTLYRLLRDHPQLVIPASKEDPIFDTDVTSDQVRTYLDVRFAGAAGLAGTVTPQYLSEPDTAARMHAFVPDARIIVLLRDPVRRAFSHHQMSTLRGLEHRTFDQAALEQLAALEAGRPLDLYSETDSYVVRGNYAWLLADWYKLYGPENILAMWTRDLDDDAVAAIHRVHDFLGVERRTPNEADFRFNASPPPHRLSRLRRPVARSLRRVGWDRISPERKERISSAVERGLAKIMPTARQDMAAQTRQALRAYYAPGHEPLAELVGDAVPWPSR